MEQKPVVCEHLQAVVDHLIAMGAKVTFAGQAWSKNCRIWVYFDRALNVDALRREFQLGPCVVVHSHRGTHDGSETGLVCEEHQDGVMGHYVER